jgi:hypothetical protein
MKTPNRQDGLGGAIGELIKRAAVDASVRKRLLAERSDVAADIGIELHPAEKKLVDTYPEDLLVAMINNMNVSSSERRTFLKTASMLAAATISAGMVGNVAAAEGAKKAKADAVEADDAAMLTQLKKIEAQLKGIRKALQKEAVKALAAMSRRKSEREEVPNSRPIMIAGIAPARRYQQRAKTPAEQARDQEEFKRMDALEKTVEEIEREVQSSLIEIREKKRSLKAK